MLTELVMPSNHLILCCPLLFLPSIFPSIRVFSREPVLHIKWPKDWSFSFCISSSSEHSGWFPLGLTGLISWQYKGVSGVFSSTTIWKSSILQALSLLWASLVAQLVKNLPVMQKTWVSSLGCEDPLKKGKASHSSILAWWIPWTL